MIKNKDYIFLKTKPMEQILYEVIKPTNDLLNVSVGDTLKLERGLFRHFESDGYRTGGYVRPKYIKELEQNKTIKRKR